MKTKTVLESLKDFLQNDRIFFHFLFRFQLTWDFRWVTERIQSPIQNLESIENEKENGKKNFCRKSVKDSKTVFFFSSIKTEEVLFFFIYIYLYIYLYIYKKLSPKWKKFQEQKCFVFDFTYCVKISVRSDQ